MIHQIANSALTIGQSLTPHVSGQDMNGLVITKDAPFIATDILMVSVSGQGVKLMTNLNNINMKSLANISNLEGGQSPTAHAFGEGAAAPTDFDVFAARVPLGVLKNVGNGSSVEVKYQAGDTGTVDIATYFDKDGPDHIITYNESHNTDQTFMGVTDLYLVCNTDLIAVATKDVSILIRSARRNTLAPLMSFLGHNAQYIEMGGVGNVLKIFVDDKNGPAEDVQVQLNGADAGDFTIISVTREMDANRIAAGMVESQQAVVKSLLSMSSEAIRAAIAAGVVSVGEVQIAARQAAHGGNLTLGAAGRIAAGLH